MKTIRITPGLGNQMFQYALMLNYKLKGEKIAFDITPCTHFKKHNGFELEKVFGIKEKILTRWEKTKINGPYLYIGKREITFIKLVNKIISKTIGEKYILNTDKYIIDKEASNEFNFNQKYLNLKGDKYISGYFCSWKYFEHIKKEIQKVFTFPVITEKDEKNFKTLGDIRNSESISIHVRRGDYLNTLSYICDEKYFIKAFDFLIKKILEKRKINRDKINVFIFSDDIDWCKRSFGFLKNYLFSFVDWNKKENSYKDMQLMSECKHNIIPNSTFSWWAAYLNKNKDKLVICPKLFVKDIKMSEDRVDWRYTFLV